MGRFWLTPFTNLMPDFDDFFDITRDFSAYPPVNMYEKDNNIVVEVRLSGFNPEDIDLAIREGNLILRGKARSKKVDENKRYFVKEIVERSFERVLPLPYEVEEQKASAEFKNGMLIVTLPKKVEKEKKNIIPIKIRK